MYFIRKLRSPSITIEHIIGIVTIVAFVILLIIFGFQKAYGIFVPLGLFYTIVNIILFSKTGNSGFLVITLLFICTMVFASYIFIYGLESNKPLGIALGVLTVSSGLGAVYIIFSKKLKWRTRELLELAAMPVKETLNGFTERPLAAGKINHTKEEILSFAMFIRKTLVAIPYIEESRVVFSIDVPFWELVWYKRDYIEDSKVVFDYDGNVSVYISKKEYLKYKDSLSFDQLCDSLGKLFIEFIDLYVKGEGVRIIDRFNALKLNPLIE